jgi:hypothetical protein
MKLTEQPSLQVIFYQDRFPVYFLFHMVPDTPQNALRFQLCLRSSKSCMETKLSRNAFNTVGRVDVLNKSDLVAGCRTLPGDNG